MNKLEISIVLPAKNEAASLSMLLPSLKTHFPHAEIIVVNDGSTDDTALVASKSQVTVINHPHSLGNGASIKAGARHAKHDTLVLMDADGQHPIDSIKILLQQYLMGYSMVVGARSKCDQASLLRWFGNTFYNKLASWIVRRPVKDLTSGLRVVNKKKFLKFLHLLPNGFSYPSTITMAFFRTGYPVDYVDVKVNKRVGKSHLKPLTDGLRFLIIIYKVATLYSPLKVFIPIAFIHFIIALVYFAYNGHLTYLSTILFSASIIIFLIGLVSEQITTLMYQYDSHENSL